MTNSKARSNELVKDIVGYAVLLMRLGHDECVTNQSLFVEMLNCATDSNGNRSFVTPSGKDFTKQNLFNLMRRIPDEVKLEIVQEIKDSGLDKDGGHSPLSDIGLMFN